MAYFQLFKEIQCLLTLSHVSLEFPICILKQYHLV